MPPKNLDPSTSPLALFGAELRRLRERADLTQEQLGQRINYSDRLVGAVETATRKPRLDFARRADETLGAEGLLVRLWELVKGETFPTWFRVWPEEIEPHARMLRSWQPLIVDGLLQTEEYARELFKLHPGTTSERVEEQVTSRMDRQKILDRDEPPQLR
ncbi:MAG: helix-turn-helix domain-containing protein [Streptosporangiales bacterium]|nr:helix-turn-helix domain-containing protein [Streptosporangiales bacterium]